MIPAQFEYFRAHSIDEALETRSRKTSPISASAADRERQATTREGPRLRAFSTLTEATNQPSTLPRGLNYLLLRLQHLPVCRLFQSG